MSFAKGIDNLVLEKKKAITDADIAGYYLGITKIPTRICSPLRQDRKPSFGLYSRDGEHIFYTDFATGDKGHIVDLLGHLWGTDYSATWERIVRELSPISSVRINKTVTSKPKIDVLSKTRTQIKVKVRDWEQYDFDYWKSYGVSKEWLMFADVHPISHIIFVKEDGKTSAIKADKLAYVFVEFKEGNTTCKVYQPLNTDGFKWFSSHDRSVISLWAKVPETGDKLCICSSLKDALCLWSNTGIPAIAPQGEGYTMSETAIKELKRRYKEIYILYDTDEAGVKDSKRLSELTGFKNLQLPCFNGGKDVSDLYKIVGRKKFINIISTLFNYGTN